MRHTSYSNDIFLSINLNNFFKTLPLVFGLNSCVTVHHGIENNFDDLLVSCSSPEVLTGRFFAVSCSFENSSDKWLSFKSTKLIPSQGHDSTFLDADHTQDFLSAYSFEVQKDRANTSLTAGGLILASLIVAGSTQDSTISDAAGATAIGISAATIGHEEYNHIRRVNRPVFGNSHILGPTTRIPPKLFVRKTAIFEGDPSHKGLSSIELCLEIDSNICKRIPLGYKNR
ncbi:MAG: hypothetical protein NT027_03260 [Proteobacteria bacterium]|nr:hypothetical protein [Pseudomonadota bacterium]